MSAELFTFVIDEEGNEVETGDYEIIRTVLKIAKVSKGQKNKVISQDGSITYIVRSVAQ